MIADITVFDAATVTDKATFSDPHHYSEGVKHVVVNGTLTVAKGTRTGARAGRVLRGPSVAPR